MTDKTLDEKAYKQGWNDALVALSDTLWPGGKNFMGDQGSLHSDLTIRITINKLRDNG